jgi:hypothetical protein
MNEVSIVILILVLCARGSNDSTPRLHDGTNTTQWGKLYHGYLALWLVAL